MNITLTFAFQSSHLISLYMTQKGMEEAPKPLKIPSLKLNIKLGLFNHLTNPQDPSTSPQNPSTNPQKPTPHTKNFYKEKLQCECQ
jgi:hypothetical protein